jgi:guanosine-3',5'-bis(diphosphate) 3'-pyrophosphohydrolase
MIAFSERLHRALDLAALAHDGQVRKDPDVAIPHVAHVMGVAFLLAGHGFDEDVVVAGLLHDVLEDSPRYAPELKAFGERVYGIVGRVSEAAKGLPWRVRKVRYAEGLREAWPEAKAVSCADKIHNMQSILLSIERGRPVWPVLTNPDPIEQVQRLRWLRDALADGWDHPILATYDATLARLAQEAERAARRRR